MSGGAKLAAWAVTLIGGYVIYQLAVPWYNQMVAAENLAKAQNLVTTISDPGTHEAWQSAIRLLNYELNMRVVKIPEAIANANQELVDLMNKPPTVKIPIKPVTVATSHADEVSAGAMFAFNVIVRPHVPNVHLLRVRCWLDGGTWQSQVLEKAVAANVEAGTPYYFSFDLPVPLNVPDYDEFVVRASADYRVGASNSDQEVEDPAPRPGVMIRHR